MYLAASGQRMRAVDEELGGWPEVVGTEQVRRLWCIFA